MQTYKIFGCSERSLMRQVDKYKSTNNITRKKRDYTSYDELVNNVKDILYEIPIHIYKNLIKGAYDRSEKYVKRPSTRKREPKKYLDQVGVLNIQRCKKMIKDKIIVFIIHTKYETKTIIKKRSTNIQKIIQTYIL